MTRREYRQRIAFPFGDADMARILYFPRLFHYCHVVMEGFVREAAGFTYQQLLDVHRIGFPTVRTEAEYHAPMPYGGDLDFRFSISRIGRSSMDFLWRVSLADEDRLRAEARSTVVCVDMDRFESRPLPDSLRDAFGPYVVVAEG